MLQVKVRTSTDLPPQMMDYDLFLIYRKYGELYSLFLKISLGDDPDRAS